MNKYDSRKRRGKKAKAILRFSTRPRLVVHRSTSNIYAQIVVRSDLGDKILVSCSTVDTELNPSLKGTKTEQAQQVGKMLGERAIAQGLKEIAFDRAGYKYHGRVKALAESAREAGLDF